jgi:hypothetical protein
VTNTKTKERLIVAGFALALAAAIALAPTLLDRLALIASCEPPLQYVQSSNGTWECV